MPKEGEKYNRRYDAGDNELREIAGRPLGTVMA